MILLYFVLLAQVLILRKPAEAQYIPLRGSEDNIYSHAPTWYGFFPPSKVERSPWPQMRKSKEELRRNVKRLPPNRSIVKNYKRWDLNHANQNMYGGAHANFMGQPVFKRPHSNYPTYALNDRNVIDKRWGPKFMIIENPYIDKNTKILRYRENPGFPEKLSSVNVEQYKVNQFDHDQISPLDIAEDVSDLQKMEQRRYKPTQEIYKAFVNTPQIIPKKERTGVTIDELYSQKGLKKPTSETIYENIKKIPIDEIAKRKTADSPNPEMERLAAKFLDSVSYKNFNVLDYIKSKKELGPNEVNRLLDKVVGKVIITEPTERKQNIMSKEKVNQLAAPKSVPTKFIKARNELIGKYIGQRNKEKKLLNERIKAIRNLAIQSYKNKYKENTTSGIHDRVDEPQYKNSFSKPIQYQKTKSNPLDSQTEKLKRLSTNRSAPETESIPTKNHEKHAKYIDTEEKEKHGTQASLGGDASIRNRPRLQLNEEMHGQKSARRNATSHKTTTTTTTSTTKGMTQDLATTRMDLDNAKKVDDKKIKTDVKPALSVNQAITSDAEKEADSPSITDAPLANDGNVQFSPDESQYEPTKPIIPNKQTSLQQPSTQQVKNNYHKMQPTKSSKERCIQCWKLPPNTKLIPLYTCCKPAPAIPTQDANGRVVPAGTMVIPFASPADGNSVTEKRPLATDMNLNSASTAIGNAKPEENDMSSNMINPASTTTVGHKQVNPSTSPAETSSPIAPKANPLLPSDIKGEEVSQPMNKPSLSSKQAANIGNQNPTISTKRPPAESCDNNECEGNLMKDMKSKVVQLYDSLYQRGGNHPVEIYSTGCKGVDCSKAIGIIKFDGIILGGNAVGMNIVVLGYPGYEFLYSKTYATGTDPKESLKMMQFLKTVKAPSIILMTAQGDATTAMTDAAWNMLADLGCRTSFIKSSGASFAFMGYKGTDILPWTQVNQRMAGDGTSGIFAILGSDTEYITFGGSGQTLTTMVKDIFLNEANPITREHDSESTSVNLLNETKPSASVKEAIKYKAPLEAENENEPQPPSNAAEISKVMKDSKANLHDIDVTDSAEPTSKIRNFATQEIQLKNNEEKATNIKELGPIPIILESDNDKSPTDRSFEAGLSDLTPENKVEDAHDRQKIKLRLPKKPEEDENKAANETKQEPEKEEPHQVEMHHDEEEHHHNIESIHHPFVGQMVNTGHPNMRPHHPLQVYDVHPSASHEADHPSSQVYVPAQIGNQEHHDEPHHAFSGGEIPNIHGTPDNHVTYQQPFEHPLQIHPIGANSEHGVMMAITPSVGMHSPMNAPLSVHNIEGYDGNYQHHSFSPGSNHHYEDNYNHEDGPWNHEYHFHNEGHHYQPNYHHEDHYDHQIPVLNIPHPYVIQSQTPIHPSTDSSHHESNHTEPAHTMLPVTHIQPHYMPHHEQEPILPPPHHDEEPHHEPEHHNKTKEEPSPANETNVEEPNEKKTPAPMTPEFQAKLKEMLATELTKKLKELKISPGSSLTTDKLAKVEASTKDSLTDVLNADGFKTITETESGENRHLEDKNNTNIDVSKMEHFVYGEANDFDNEISNEIKNEKEESSKSKSNGKVSDEGNVSFSGPNYDYDSSNKEESETNVGKSTDIKVKAQDEEKEKVKNSEDSPKKDKEDAVSEQKEKEDDHSKADGKKNKDTQENVKESENKGKKLKEDMTTGRDEDKNAKEPVETVQYKTAKEEKTSKQPKESKNTKTKGLTLKYIEKKLKDAHNVSGLNRNEEHQDLEKLTDTQEELPDEPQKTETNPLKAASSDDSSAKQTESALSSMIDASVDSIDKENLPQQHSAFMHEGNNVPDESKTGIKDVSNVVETSVDGNDASSGDSRSESPLVVTSMDEKESASICKRYKLSKREKKLKLMHRKNCITKISSDYKTKSKSKVQPLPDASETVTALSMNPGYSTLPGAEGRSSAQNEVSYYFQNKDKDSLPVLKDNVYGDVTSSNIYDQGDYVNTAEKLLQKDVSEAYNTANDILSAEEAMDKGKITRKKKTMIKHERRAKLSHDRRSKRGKLSGKQHRKWLDEKLLEDSFRW